MKRFRGGLVVRLRHFISLNSRLESHAEEEDTAPARATPAGWSAREDDDVVGGGRDAHLRQRAQHLPSHSGHFILQKLLIELYLERQLPHKIVNLLLNFTS